MHYYQFNIGDYHSHTAHLEPLEDLAYRRLLDLYYLHESPLPDDAEQVAKLVRMRTHSECIADVLLEFFTRTADGWKHDRADREIAKYNAKSEKAKNSAKARWASKHAGLSGDANALRTQTERNAKHKPLTINQEPINNNGANANRFCPPTLEEIKSYCVEKGYKLDPDHFFNFYESKGWMVGKSKMKKWKAAIANWESRNRKENAPTKTGSGTKDRTLMQDLTDRSWAE